MSILATSTVPNGSRGRAWVMIMDAVALAGISIYLLFIAGPNVCCWLGRVPLGAAQTTGMFTDLLTREVDPIGCCTMCRSHTIYGYVYSPLTRSWVPFGAAQLTEEGPIGCRVPIECCTIDEYVLIPPHNGGGSHWVPHHMQGPIGCRVPIECRTINEPIGCRVPIGGAGSHWVLHTEQVTVSSPYNRGSKWVPHYARHWVPLGVAQSTGMFLRCSQWSWVLLGAARSAGICILSSQCSWVPLGAAQSVGQCIASSQWRRVPLGAALCMKPGLIECSAICKCAFSLLIMEPGPIGCRTVCRSVYYLLNNRGGSHWVPHNVQVSVLPPHNGARSHWVLGAH
ncbi:hypothetical protein BDR05DRAFT_950303 [Suillus weaverae]|nr:hypothetical protein BDR05DRAFT_950303 [Suillus weaverae]